MTEKQQSPTYLHWYQSLLCFKKPDCSDLCWRHSFICKNKASPLNTKFLAQGKNSRLEFLCWADAIGQSCWLTLRFFDFATPVFFWSIFSKKCNWPMEKKKIPHLWVQSFRNAQMCLEALFTVVFFIYFLVTIELLMAILLSLIDDEESLSHRSVFQITHISVPPLSLSQPVISELPFCWLFYSTGFYCCIKWSHQMHTFLPKW